MQSRLPLTKLLSRLSPEIREDVERLLPDVSEAELVRKSVTDIEHKAINAEERSVTRYISTREIDRDGEILVPKGAVTADYERNPVVVFGHDYTQPPHARSEYVKSDGYGLKSKTVYAETPRGEEIWQLVKGGFLNAASVGFIPVSWVDNPKSARYLDATKPTSSWGDVTAQLGEEWGVKPTHFRDVSTIYTKWMLLEYSDVPVPSNAASLIQRAKSMGISDAMLKALDLKAEDDTEEAQERQEPLPVAQQVKLIGYDVRPIVAARMDVREIVREAILRAQGRP